MPIARSISLATVVAVALTVGCKEDPPPAQKKLSSGANAPSSAAAPAKPERAKGEPPASLGPIKIPDDNPITPEKVELGRQLFFDARLSGDGSRSCYSCHQNEDGTGGHEPTAIGAMEKKLTRHAPIIWNVAYLPRLYWDGRSDSLEAQMKGAWGGGNMGVGKEGLADKAKELGKIAGYAKAFEAAFPGEGATPETVAKAVASYERTLFCGDTLWDRAQAGGAKLGDEADKGWKLFIGKAACNNCHTPPFFSDAYQAAEGAYHNIGISMKGKAKADIDVGRKNVSKADADWATFKTPTLRNVSKSPPYFHDGSVATLEEAVRFMAGGGFKNDNLDSKLEDKKLTDAEIAQVVAFLGTLDCSDELEKPELP